MLDSSQDRLGCSTITCEDTVSNDPDRTTTSQQEIVPQESAHEIGDDTSPSPTPNPTSTPTAAHEEELDVGGNDENPVGSVFEQAIDLSSAAARRSFGVIAVLTVLTSLIIVTFL